MRDLAIAALVLALLADVLWVNARLVAEQNLNKRFTAGPPAQSRKSERRSGRPAPQRRIPPASPVDLEAWDAEVDGLPWGYASDFSPADVRPHVDRDGHTVWCVFPPRPSTLMLRRIAG